MTALVCAVGVQGGCCMAAMGQERTTVAPMRMPREIERRGRGTAPIVVRQDTGPGEDAAQNPDETSRAGATNEERRRAPETAAAPGGIPVDGARVARLSESLGTGFARFESASVVMLADTTAAAAHARLGSLEMARAEVLRWARRTGIEPTMEASKHVCVLFAVRAAYIEFAAREDGLDASGLGGHYSPSKERMALYADPPGIAPSDGLRIRAMHEAAHMALFRTGVQSRRRTQPFWLSEGLASAFEPEGEMPSAPDRERKGFREVYLDSPSASRVAVDWLVSRDEPGVADGERVHAMYRTSEAMVRYLSRHRRGALAAYMAALRNGKPGTRTAAELREEFVEHFGDPARVEREMALRPW